MNDQLSYYDEFVSQIGKGLLRVMQIDWNAVADIVPVDFVNNMLLAIGWVTAMNRLELKYCKTGILRGHYICEFDLSVFS